MTPFVTSSERWFANYLTAHGYSFEYDHRVEATGKRPDFRIHSKGGPVFVEVTEVTGAIVTQPWAPGEEIVLDAMPDWAAKIGKKLAKKNKQVARIDEPVMLLIATPDWPLEPHDFFQAMFGALQLSVPIGGAGKSYMSTSGSGAKFQRKVNTRWSALGHLQLVNPTYPHLKRALAALQATEEPIGSGTDERVVRGMVEQSLRAMAAAPGFDSGAVAPRVRVFDNPFAARQRAMPDLMFRGAFDDRYRHDGSQTYEQVWAGPHADDARVVSWRE